MSESHSLKPDSKWHEIRKIVRKKRVFDVNNPRTGSNWDHVYQHVKDSTVNFFGLQGDEARAQQMHDKWNHRLEQLYGKSGMFALKDEGKPLMKEIEMDQYGGDVVDGLLPSSRERVMKPKGNVFRVTYDSMVGKKKKFHNRSYALSDIHRTRLAERNMPRPIGQSKFFDQAQPTSGAVRREPISTQPYRVDLPNGMRVRHHRKPSYFDEVDSSARRIEGIDGRIMEELMDNSHREMGTGGWVGKYLLQMERDHSKLDQETIKQLASTKDVLHRPFFTYWVTFVQVVCYIVTVAVYGFAPIGFHETTFKDEVYSSKMYVESVSYTEKDNLWIGPRQADLIHLGAKYSPCMRRDSNIEAAIEADRQRENQTGCCVRNDGAGCVQTPLNKCSSILSTWLHGKVCGQDPDYCAAPASVAPFEWSDSIVDWPICTQTVNLTGSMTKKNGPDHMTCQQAGKPCCIGIQGECRVVTREECAFVRGYFHHEASLCAQVSCMDKTCGMLPFWNPDSPDQFYRLWISLFIHAGLIQLLITVVFQFVYMRDVEKLFGWFRVALIYLLSGVVGSLASAIFVPYHVEAGPTGSQFGILSCLFVELSSTYRILRSPLATLFKLLAVLLLLFVIGLLPMVDNYAHLFGFVYGFLLSFSLMPHVGFSLKDRKIKTIAVVCSFVGSFVILLILALLFYIIPIYHCPYCQYFNCIPFTEGFCDTMEVKVRRPVL